MLQGRCKKFTTPLVALVDHSCGVSFTVLHNGLVPPSEGILRKQVHTRPCTAVHCCMLSSDCQQGLVCL